jgi:ketosteroid isomerase-like protein
MSLSVITGAHRLTAPRFGPKEGGVIVIKRSIIFCLAASLAFFIACSAGGTNREADTTASADSATKPPAAPVDQRVVVDEVRSVLQAHDKALSEKNIDALMDTFSTDPNTVVLGTGTEERWVGPQEIKAAYTEMFKDYDPNTMQSDCDWKTGGSDPEGSMAWFAATCSCKDSLQGKVRNYKLNVTASLAKQSGKWHFVALHMSNAFTPPVTK